MSTEKQLRGRVLQVSKGTAGYSSVKLDNGPFRTVTIHCHAEGLSELLDADLSGLVSHLLTREKGHFRSKPKK